MLCIGKTVKGPAGGAAAPTTTAGTVGVAADRGKFGRWQVPVQWW